MTESALIRAQGKFVILLATFLQRAGALKLKEFGDALTIFAAVVAETDEEEGDILAYWAALFGDA